MTEQGEIVDAQVEIDELRHQLREANETIEAIRSGAVDAFVGQSNDSDLSSAHVYTLEGADRPYRILVERMHQGAATLDQYGQILYCNLRFEQLLGQQDQSLIGRSMRNCFAGEQQIQFDELLEQATHLISTGEFQLEKLNASTTPALLTLHQMPVESGVAIAVLVTDLTSQKIQSELTAAVNALRESDAKFRQLADSMSQLVWMAKADGEIDWYNQRWYDYTGTTPEEMIGWGWKSVHDAKQLPEVLRRWSESLTNATPFEMTFRLRGRDGLYKPFLTRAIPILDGDGNLVRWFGTNTDITQECQMQDQLRSSAARLSEYDRRKDDFLATLAHELRNPLSPIKTAAQMMRRQISSIDELRELGGVIDRQVIQMVRLIDDLLDVSRISRGKIKLRVEVCNLQDLLRSAIEAAEPFISQSGQTFTVEIADEPLFLKADCARIVQVVVNLLNNAAKYTPASGKIWLSARQQGDLALIQVRDNGIGLSKKDLQTVFEMFEQVESAKERGQSGLGIGLSLVKSLVELHEGSVYASSEGLDQGSTFSVQIPLTDERVALSKCADDDDADVAIRPFRVLVVEDTRAIRHMMVRLLRSMGHEVSEAENGQEGFQVATQQKPEVIFSDISMPIMNGHELASQVRANSELSKIYLVALTGYGQEADRLNALQSGFNTHIVKPVDMSVLTSLFKSLSVDSRIS